MFFFVTVNMIGWAPLWSFNFYCVYSIQVRYSRGDKQHMQARDDDPITLLLEAHRIEEAEIGAESEQNKYLAMHKSSEDIRLSATIGEVRFCFGTTVVAYKYTRSVLQWINVWK